MKSVDRCFGKKVENQVYCNDYHTLLLGRSPRREDILLNEDSKGCFMYDGEHWREFNIDKWLCD